MSIRFVDLCVVASVSTLTPLQPKQREKVVGSRQMGRVPSSHPSSLTSCLRILPKSPCFSMTFYLCKCQKFEFLSRYGFVKFFCKIPVKFGTVYTHLLYKYPYSSSSHLRNRVESTYYSITDDG